MCWFCLKGSPEEFPKRWNSGPEFKVKIVTGVGRRGTWGEPLVAAAAAEEDWRWWSLEKGSREKKSWRMVALEGWWSLWREERLMSFQTSSMVFGGGGGGGGGGEEEIEVVVELLVEEEEEEEGRRPFLSTLVVDGHIWGSKETRLTRRVKEDKKTKTGT